MNAMRAVRPKEFSQNTQKSAFTEKNGVNRREAVLMPLTVRPRDSTTVRANAWWEWRGPPRGQDRIPVRKPLVVSKIQAVLTP